MREKKKHEFLTEVELEFMSKLWTLGEATVRDVLDKLPNERGLAYPAAKKAKAMFINRLWQNMLIKRAR